MAIVRLAGVPAGVLLAAVSLAGQVRLPSPTGAHGVGRVEIEVTRSTGSDARSVPVMVWYPAVPGTGVSVPYLPDLAERSGVLGADFARAAGEVVSSARGGAAPADGRFPVVLLSHSLGGLPGLYAGLGEDLASRGYVVAAVGHPGGAGGLLVDGAVIPASPEWDRNDPAVVGIERAFEFRSTRVRVWVGDVLGVLERLPSVRVGAETLGARADTGRVAYVGHSVGGSAAALGCALSPRLDACVNLDGWPVPAPARSGFPGAYFHLEETRPYRTDGELDDWGVTRAEYDRNMTGLAARMDSLLQAMEGPAYHLVLAGLTHQGFSDLPLWREENRQAQALSGPRALTILRDWLGWFLDRHVRGDAAAAVPDPVRYPEILFTAYGAGWAQDRPDSP